MLEKIRFRSRYKTFNVSGVNTILPLHPQNPCTLQTHLPVSAQKTTLRNSHLRRLLFLSTTMAAWNATSYTSSTWNLNAPMTFRRALGTKLSPKPVLMPCNVPMRPKQRKQSVLWPLYCQMQPQGLAHTQWLPSWITPPTLLDIPQTTHQWS